MEIFQSTITGLIDTSGFTGLGDIRCIIMILLSFVLFYLAIVRQYEPLLMLPIAFADKSTAYGTVSPRTVGSRN